MTIREKINTGLLTIAVALFGFMAIGAVSTTPVEAQAAQRQACEGAGGNWTGERCENTSGFSVEGVVESVLDVLFYVVGIASVIMLIIGGIRYVVSGGDQNAVAGAKNTILYAVVGLVIAFAAFAISNFVINTIGGESPGDASGSGDSQSAIVRVIA